MLLLGVDLVLLERCPANLFLYRAVQAAKGPKLLNLKYKYLRPPLNRVIVPVAEAVEVLVDPHPDPPVDRHYSVLNSDLTAIQLNKAFICYCHLTIVNQIKAVDLLVLSQEIGLNPNASNLKETGDALVVPWLQAMPELLLQNPQLSFKNIVLNFLNSVLNLFYI